MRGRVEAKLSYQPGLPLGGNTAEENQVFVGWRFADTVDKTDKIPPIHLPVRQQRSSPEILSK